jgi:DMSO/TMAO reductase YedYZ molybdopterin-dependent catalytic subunit
VQTAIAFLREHRQITRRYFFRLGLGTYAAMSAITHGAHGESPGTEFDDALEKLEAYLTVPDKFQDVSRGDPLPHSLPDEKKREVGLTRESWRLEILADTDPPTAVRKPLTKAAGNSLDFSALLQLAERMAVKFAKVMTCLNIGCPLGMGIWEGVPLRELIWLAQPGDNVRRVVYYGYHNDDPKQLFRSSLPIGRVFEDPFDLPPVIVCYKLNGQWLGSERGGPVRMVVPEAYGFKSIKWLTHVVLTNLPHANDTYADGGNDIDSPLKSFAATLSVPRELSAGQKIPVTGYAQVGIGGLSKVQAWVQPDEEDLPAGDPYFIKAPWIDMTILPPPKQWGGGLPDDRIPIGTLGFDAQGRPRTWPMRLCKTHWAGLLPGLPSGRYTLRCRAVDEKGHGQPLPRPFRKSGHAAIEQIALTIK